MQLYLIFSVCSRVPQHLNLGTIDIFGWIFLCCVCVDVRACLILCIIECVAASLTPTHCMPVTHPSPSATNKNDSMHCFLGDKTTSIVTWHVSLQVRAMILMQVCMRQNMRLQKLASVNTLLPHFIFILSCQIQSKPFCRDLVLHGPLRFSLLKPDRIV